MKAQTHLNQLLAEDILQEVFAALLNHTSPLDDEKKAEIVLLSGKLAHIEKHERLGTADKQEVNLERNRICAALKTIVDAIPVDFELNPVQLKQRKIRRYLFFAMSAGYVLATTFLLIYALQPKSNVRIEAQLLLEQVSFRHLEGTYGFGGKSLSALHLYNYAHMEADGNYFQMVKSTNKQSNRTPDILAGPLFIEPYLDVTGVGINHGFLNLEEIRIPPRSLITLIRPGGMLEPLQVRIQHEAPVFGRLIYSDSLDITLEQTKIKTGEQSFNIFGPTLLRIFSEQGVAREVKFESYSGIFSCAIPLV